LKRILTKSFKNPPEEKPKSPMMGKKKGVSAANIEQKTLVPNYHV
jgi:hypothetical protein